VFALQQGGCCASSREDATRRILKAEVGKSVGELGRKSRVREVICERLTEAHAGAIMDGLLAR
jgi:cytidylate kinase